MSTGTLFNMSINTLIFFDMWTSFSWFASPLSSLCYFGHLASLITPSDRDAMEIRCFLSKKMSHFHSCEWTLQQIFAAMTPKCNIEVEELVRRCTNGNTDAEVIKTGQMWGTVSLDHYLPLQRDTVSPHSDGKTTERTAKAVQKEQHTYLFHSWMEMCLQPNG